MFQGTGKLLVKAYVQMPMDVRGPPGQFQNLFNWFLVPSPVSQFQINFQEICWWGKLGRHKSPLWPRSFLQSICFQCWRECGRDALRHQRSKIFLLGVVHQGLVWKGLPSNPLDWQPCYDCTNHWAPHVFLPCQGDLSCSSWQKPWLHDEICGEKR